MQALNVIKPMLLGFTRVQLGVELLLSGKPDSRIDYIVKRKVFPEDAVLEAQGFAPDHHGYASDGSNHEKYAFEREVFEIGVSD